MDLGVLARRRTGSAGEATRWTMIVAGTAALFAGALWLIEGRHATLQFATGYIVELSLSVDNLLVFIMIFRYFSVPTELQATALSWGILGAIVMRAIMITGGALLLAELNWVILILGVLLIITGARMATASSEPAPSIEHNFLLRAVRRVLPFTAKFSGRHFFVREDGRVAGTPLLLVVLVIEWTDLLFATDSIPAIFGITQHPILVYTSNIFAIVGLRALFLTLAAGIARFAFLRLGVAAVLVLVGIKMVLALWVVAPVEWSLLVIVLVLGSSIVASIVSERRN